MPWFRRQQPGMIVSPERRFYRFGGRRHLRDTPYVLPKDEHEIQRLDFQHFLLRYGLSGNHAAPIEQPHAILDVGCGTGRWAMETAVEFPQAAVVGVDLVPAEHMTMGYGLDGVPANYTFTQANVLEGLPFPADHFDYVHQRLLIAALPADKWPQVVAELARVTRPGGWIELAECGVPEEGGPGLTRLWGSWIELCGKRGIDFTLGHTLGDKLRAGGLSNVAQREVRFPMGAYGGRVGTMSGTDCLAVGKALRTGVTATGIASEPEYDRLYVQTQEEFSRPRGKAVLPFYVAFGQKPELA